MMPIGRQFLDPIAPGITAEQDDYFGIDLFGQDVHNVPEFVLFLFRQMFDAGFHGVELIKYY